MSDIANIRPLGDRIVVQRSEKESKTAGGIVIPENSGDKPSEGKVMAVGPGKHLESGSIRTPDVKVGDKVLFGKYSGSEIKLAGKDCLVLREEDIMAVVL
ncbi:MAG: co-chaperone GroES [Gammaproteobacteria bacterium]|nr:co-chaperone GroES [Gammaproteobacteria bacterium]